jgi:hypothetical protein
MSDVNFEAEYRKALSMGQLVHQLLIRTIRQRNVLMKEIGRLTAKPQWTNADTTPPTEEGYYWVILVPGGKPVMCEYSNCWKMWLQSNGEYANKFEGTHYIKINEPESL